jgi:ribosomal 50S subunit-recycling heat shock protein
VSIPAKVAQDSAFTIKEGDVVEVRFDKKQNAVIIRTRGAEAKKAES